MKYFSMFSGVGGFEYGIQQAGFSNARVEEERVSTPSMEYSADTRCENGCRGEQCSVCVGYSEIDPYASAVYEYHYRGTKNYGDATKINARELPDFDCLVGGFPCQAFSIAGKRGGFEDTRGTLFFDIVRIAREKQPRLLVLENVKGLLSHDQGRTFLTILSTLDEMGYDAEWEVINSKNFGVPQNRERVFIIARLRGTSGREILPLGQSDREVDSKPEIVGNTNNAGRGERSRVYGVDGIMTTLTATDYKQPKQIIQLNNPKHSQQRVYDPEGISPTIAAGNLGGGKSPSKILQINQPQHSNDRVYSPEGVSPTLNTMQGGLRQPFIAAMRGRNPTNPSDRTTGAPTEQRLEPNTHGTSNCLSTVEKDNLVVKTPRIRRLTPRECERLQGFPDDWTKYGLFNGEVKEISDTQRYKMMGNAVTTNVITAIFEKVRLV